MSEMAERVREALKARFTATVSEGAGRPFAETGVTVPGDAVWEAYARAAIEALPLREWLDQMEADWSQIGSEWGMPDDTIEKDIAAGRAEPIRQLRELLAALTQPPPSR
jgi:hypothetical protein